MSHQDIRQTDQFDINEEFMKELGQDFSYFDPCPHDFISHNLEEQCLPDVAFDSLDVPPLPTMEWIDYGTQRTNHMVEVVEDLALQTQPTATHHDMADEAPKRGGELETVVLRLQERTERLEKKLENLQNEREEERERLCMEVEKNVKKLEGWNAELKQIVVNLVEELSGAGVITSR